LKDDSRIKTVGILGGGQLSRMLAEAALDLKVAVNVFLNTYEESARGLEGLMYFSPEESALFAKSSDVLCFESEFFDVKYLDEFRMARASLIEQPSLKTLSKLRDKLEQKKVFAELGFSQPHYLELDSSVRTIDSLLAFTKTHFPGGCVLKRALGGYDGKGNYFLSLAKMGALKVGEQYAAEEVSWLLAFIESAHREGSKIYLESWVDFERELAVVAYPHKGGVKLFPLVESFQEKGVCREVWGPYASESALSKLRSYAEKLAKSYPDLGVFAIECFESKGEIFVNEMAPRVHNSAHYTRLFPMQSQFHAHMALLSGASFEGVPEPKGAFVMRNILGPDAWNVETPAEAAAIFEDVFSEITDALWYKKSFVKSMRKMGHVCLEVESVDHVESMKAHLKSLEETFWKRVREAALNNIKIE